MSIIAIIFGGAILYALFGGSASASTTGRADPNADIPPEDRSFLLALIEKVKGHKATCEEIRRGIAIAEAHNRPETLARLREEEILVCTVDEELTPKIDPNDFNKSPIGGVSDETWGLFALWGAQGKVNTITPGYNLGAFIMSMRQLQDLGWAKNVRRQDYNGRKVWKGEWVEPHSLDRFLSSPAEQYQAFAEIMARNAKAIRARGELQYQATPGSPLAPLVMGESQIEGHPVTFSGLLGVSKQAGLQGLYLWLTDAANRKANTTKAFIETTGIF